jgi:anti-anti-sigma factor
VNDGDWDDLLMGRTLTISPSGILDAELGSKLRSQVIQALKDKPSLIQLDMKEVSFMDSSGFGSLVMILKNVRDADANLVLRDVNAQIRLVLELTGTDKVFRLDNGPDSTDGSASAEV